MFSTCFVCTVPQPIGPSHLVKLDIRKLKVPLKMQMVSHQQPPAYWWNPGMLHLTPNCLIDLPPLPPLLATTLSTPPSSQLAACFSTPAPSFSFSQLQTSTYHTSTPSGFWIVSLWPILRSSRRGTPKLLNLTNDHMTLHYNKSSSMLISANPSNILLYFSFFAFVLLNQTNFCYAQAHLVLFQIS